MGKVWQPPHLDLVQKNLYMYAYHHLLACWLSLDGKESLKKEKGHAATLIGPMATPSDARSPAIWD